jgi:hypothetical protein
MQIQVDGDDKSVTTDANTSATEATPEVAADVAVVDEAEDIVTIGDSPPPAKEQDEEDEIAKAPSWVKQLRAENKEKVKKIRELEAKLSASQAPAPVAARPVLPKKPKLEDVDFDEEKFEASLIEWTDVKRKHDKAEAEARLEAEAAAKEAQGKLAAYKAASAALKVDDFAGAEDVVIKALSIEQQNILLAGTDNPHLVVYALGTSPEKAKELASIKDPARFAVAVGKLEAQIKVAKRSSSLPPPERKPGSSGHVATVDQKLERLEEEADRTGDRTKVAAYRRELKDAQKRK